MLGLLWSSYGRIGSHSTLQRNCYSPKKMMAEDLDQFLEDQKAKVAQDKAKYENDPPYMEMQNKSTEKFLETSKMLISMAKENIPPNSQQTTIHDYGLSLPLGEEYEHKKHKLKEELRQDYRRYLSQKKYLTSGEVDPYTQGLSLPIGDRKSAKDRLRLERNKEYNQYIKGKEEWNERLRRVQKSHTEHDTEKHQGPTVARVQSELHIPSLTPRADEDSVKKDACTSTDGYEGLSSRKPLLVQYSKSENEIGSGDRILQKKLDEKLNAYNQRNQRLNGKPDISVRRHHRLDDDNDLEINDEMDPRFRYESDYDKRPLRVFHAPRSQGNSPANDQAQSTPGTAPYATGLIIGAQDRELIQKRKEQYRQELMEQIAEQRRNKQREKELELSVAASGAVDPEKMPNRLKEFGLTPRIPEERIPPARPRPAFQTPTPVPTSISAPPISPVNEDFHKGLSAAFGEMLAPRITTLPPPPPPPQVLPDNYRTPYDDAYYFYGARNPLDPSLANYGTGVMGVQPSSAPPPVNTIQRPPTMTLSKIRTSVTNDRPRGLGMFPEEQPKRTREATLTYQQELQQQIKEREERRRQEKEEKERYEAKIEAEMRHYNPWGKGGGGAPLRDKKGNLITDLNMMHKQNEDAYHNPEARVHEDKKAIVSVDLSLASPRLENADESTNKVADFTYTETSPFARGNVFGEPPTAEQLRRQESYKNFLRFQMEEKRKKEEEEREKRRLEEEKEEKRLAEQRARIQKEYEEELEKKRRKEEEQRLKNEELYRLAEEWRKEADNKKTDEEGRQDNQNNEMEQYKMIEEQKISRQPSPVVTVLMPLVKEEKPVVMESRTAYYKYDLPRVRSPPVPARRNQLRAYEERKNVISELSEMRKQLRSEERRLQEQLLKVHSDDSDVSVKGRKKDKHSMDVFEMARLRMQAPVRRPSSKDLADPVNVQNIREFNELMFKDSETRVEVRSMFPDPPTNDDTLDIQQQALLREQKKKLEKMRRKAEGTLDFDGPASGYKSRRERMVRNDESNEFLKTSLLESESAFIGTDGETFPTSEVHITPPPPLSARERRRERKKEDASFRVTPPPQSEDSSLHSNSSLNIDQLKARNEERLRRLKELQRNAIHIADDISLGNADEILKELPSEDGRRCSSVDTVATEPWLRPGTSETLKRFMSEQSSQAKLSSEKKIPFNWQGLSTAHG